MKKLFGCERRELASDLTGAGWPAYRVDQITGWVYRQNVRDWDAMSNLPAQLRAYLAAAYTLSSGTADTVTTCQDGTLKALIRWGDRAATETVLIADGQRRTVCVSTQVGCAIGCVFCASGAGGLERSLDAGEMVEQVIWATDQLGPSQRLSNVVFMGMGEPLLNYEQTLKAAWIINADWALNIGARHITISTIGLPKQIRRLAGELLQLTLAVSLHAADDQLRRTLIPAAKNVTLAELFAAIDYYYQQTHREVTLEYVLLDGVNCSQADADKLARWAQRSRCNVNLINYNPVAGSAFTAVPAATAKAFLQRLEQRGVNAHLRRSRGADIDAACGQLRARQVGPGNNRTDAGEQISE